MQVKRIMVLTELNRLSEISLEFTVDLAHKLNVKEIVLLNLIISAHQQTSDATDHAIDATGQLANELNTAILKKHKKITEQQASEYSDNEVTILPSVKFSDSASTLNDFMKEYQTDLLICGSRDKLSFLEILFGSATEKMVRKVDYPMIVLTEEPEKADIHNIALAIDLEEDNQQGIEAAIDFARLLNAQLQLVYVITNNNIKANEAIEGLQKFAKGKNIKNYSINVLNSQSLEDGLEGFVQKTRPDMLALVSQGKRKLHKLIYGSNTEEVISELEIPIFVCKTQ